jgi:hypothetical protein
VRDRLVQTLAALEDLLLIHNLEPAEYTVEQRLGKLLDALGQSEEVMQNVREVYRISERSRRTRFESAGRKLNFNLRVE